MSSSNTTNPADKVRLPPEEQFDVIVADPPWDVLQKGRLGAIQHYDLMTLEQIKGMGPAMKAIAKDDSHLWLWVTQAVLISGEGHKVAEAWGFAARSILTWIKPTIALGQTLRHASEYVIFATRGKAPVKFRSQPDWAFWPRLGHSVKPDDFYAVVSRVSGDEGRRLELFARRKYPGYMVWGNEINSDVSLAPWGYPVPSDFDEQSKDGKDSDQTDEAAS